MKPTLLSEKGETDDYLIYSKAKTTNYSCKCDEFVIICKVDQQGWICDGYYSHKCPSKVV